MEPRITTLLDQSPYKRFTLDPSVLTTTSSSVAPRYNEPATSVNEARLTRDSQGYNDHVEGRDKTSSQAHSGAPLARVLNDPACPSRVLQPTSGCQTPQHAAFRIGNDDPRLGSTLSPDARRRDQTHNSVGNSGGDASLIQLPKPPQAPRKIVKRPRIPPLLQGLHQPPPLPPKSRLFPPITSERGGLGSDVSDRFGLGNAFASSSTEELAKARASPHKTNEAESDDARQSRHADSSQKEHHRLGPGVESTANHPPVTQTSSQAQSQVKAPRKRTKWSQKETEDLLTGVSRFGIGRWKQILDCTDFHFQGRTAVDLKDRFRVCRPGEGLKVRKAMAPEKAKTSCEPRGALSSDNVADHAVPPAQQTSSGDMEVQDSGSQTATSKTSVHGPFLKSKRRARREFSDTDDKNLLKGFKRYGPVWHSMRDNLELGFDMRHPTDLRDRFRIRYPELFSQAGYKLKPKEQRVLKERASEQEGQVPTRATDTADKTCDTSGDVVVQRRNEKSTTHAIVTTTPSIPPVTPAATTLQPDSTRPTFNLMTDLTFDDDDDDGGDRSPIVLNRNILQWADENSSSVTPATSAAAVASSTQPNPHTSTDLLYNPFPPSDGLHINPLATLKLPSTMHWTYTNPPTTTTTAAPSLPPPGPLMHGTSLHSELTAPASNGRASSNTTTTTTTTTTSSSTTTTTTAAGNNLPSAPPPAPRSLAEMRTPNLPNIVFPHVPNASARNAVHNLPPPADILSLGHGGYIWIG